MVWKEVGRDEFWAEDDGTYGPRLLVKLKPAKRYRLTLEEETHECCDRWRGKRVVASEVVTFSRIEWSEAQCAFCPVCGRKL